MLRAMTAEHEGGRIMDGQQQRAAQFYARLASIPSLDDLREGERLLLTEDLDAVTRSWFQEVIMPNIDELHPHALTRGLDVSLREALPGLHYMVRDPICGLLDGEVIRAPYGAIPELTWRLKNGVVHEERDNSKSMLKKFAGASFATIIQEYCLIELAQILRQKPFPFRRCVVCRQVFVPVKRQRYCSPNCAFQGTETMNKKEKKREYMRAYMAKQRQKAKARQGRKEKK
jgi:hypothetical protein